MGLSDQQCQDNTGKVSKLNRAKTKELLEELKSPWQVVRNKKLCQEFKFSDFDEAMYFVNEVAALAECENHHPDVHIYCTKVVLELSTHSVDGLSENDFIFASKVELL